MLKLTALSDSERLVERFPELSVAHGAIFRELARSLIDGGHSAAEVAHAFVIPGRIEVLGKHTDYAGGRSLTCSTEQGFCLVAVARDDRQVEIEDVGRSVHDRFAIEASLEPSAPDWTRYAKTVARRLARDFGERGAADLRGADIALASDLPAAAGMSSSSALVVGLFQVLVAVNRIEERPEYLAEIGSPEELAGYLAAVENGRPFGSFGGDLGVGTFGGSEDHTAILCSAAGRIGQYSYAPVRRERSLEMPADHVFAVASSGVRAEKTGAARESYNRISSCAAAVARVWREATGNTEPDLGSILASAPEAIDRLRRTLESADVGALSAIELLDRLEHFRRESESLVPQAGDALERTELAVFGLVADRSQHLAQRLLGNQIPETVVLAEAARELGAVAASSFGAGFGGAVWALVEESDADELAESWLAHYLESYPEHESDALALITAAARPAEEIGG